LEKRRKLDSDKCLFCEKESIEHLFFSCVVAKQSWLDVSEAVGFPIGLNFESTAKCWLCNKKFGIVNLITSAVCWGIWKLRNLLCFQEGAWKSMKQLWHVVVPMIRCWSILLPLKLTAGFDDVMVALEKRAMGPLLIEDNQDRGGRNAISDAGGISSADVRP
jgi:hypothetical protein